MMDRRETGVRGEKLAAGHLKKRGYRIIETNYRCRDGEIDIVARKKDCMVFVEVRTRTTTEFGLPEESVSRAKQGRMRRAAIRYVQAHRGLPEAWRIDFVAVELDRAGKPTRIEVIENAVGDA
jgi:putative endonuclease